MKYNLACRLIIPLGILFTLIISGCSDGKIELSNKNADCRSISIPAADSMTVPMNLNEIEADLVHKNQSLFEDIEAATLINTNKLNIITFTVKIEKINESLNLQASETKLIKLNPGEESVLGCTQEVSFILDSTRQTFRTDTFDIAKFKYSITGAVKNK